MKYALIPLLGEVKQLIEDNEWQNHDPKYFHETAYQTDAASEVGPAALCLLHRIYCTQFKEGRSNEDV